MGSDSVVSERALREVYLKGFEIAVKESQPMSITTSYNLHRELAEGTLTIRELKACIARLVSVIWRSNQYLK